MLLGIRLSRLLELVESLCLSQKDEANEQRPASVESPSQYFRARAGHVLGVQDWSFFQLARAEGFACDKRCGEVPAYLTQFRRSIMPCHFCSV